MDEDGTVISAFISTDQESFSKLCLEDSTEKITKPCSSPCTISCIWVMVGNAQAERIFSIQNRMKTRLRMNLTIEHLDQLVRLSNTEGMIESFDFDSA